MLYSESPQDFEQRVAAIYRVLGADTIHGHALAGNKIDVYVEERAADGSVVRTAIECKAYSRPVEAEAVHSVAGLAWLLRQRKLVDRAAIVSAAGFTARARSAAEEHGISLVTIADLDALVRQRESQVDSAIVDLQNAQVAAESSPRKARKVFVIMPFAPEFDDVYILGVREVAERLGLVVERADDIEHNENILSMVHASIRAADLVIGETTSRNPNCFYEVGYAHALGKATILIGRSGQEVPVDLRAMNHVFYGSIVELRDALTRRITATLSLTGSASAT